MKLDVALTWRSVGKFRALEILEDVREIPTAATVGDFFGDTPVVLAFAVRVNGDTVFLVNGDDVICGLLATRVSKDGLTSL